MTSLSFPLTKELTLYMETMDLTIQNHTLIIKIKQLFNPI